MGKRNRFSAEVRERAVRLVMESQSGHDSQWSAITSVAAKIGCTPETLRKWVRQAERDVGNRTGLTTEERERLKELERENRELKRANVFADVIDMSTPTWFVVELDRDRDPDEWPIRAANDLRTAMDLAKARPGDRGRFTRFRRRADDEGSACIHAQTEALVWTRFRIDGDGRAVKIEDDAKAVGIDVSDLVCRPETEWET